MKVAVVGSGVSGLAATWLLNEYSDHEVHLFEADSRPGGHAHTVKFKKDKLSPEVDVDTGFIVFNPSTYPNFLRFLALYPSLKSAIQPTDMTFSVSRDGGAFEWAGNANGVRAFFTQYRRWFEPRMWRLLYDIFRFNACARRLVMDERRTRKNRVRGREDGDEISVGEYLRREGYSDTFRDDYLLPMTAAIWSTPADKCALDFPAKTLIRFLNNHHLLQLTGKPSWLTLRGGSRVYVNQIFSALPSSQLHLNMPIHGVSTYPSSATGHKARLHLSSSAVEEFDHVILACHSDTTLRLLRYGEVTEEEERILGAFEWNRNEAVLHSDTRLMPKDRVAWSCWNYLTLSGDSKREDDWMNALQHIPEHKHGPVLVTLNPPFEPRAESVVGRYAYDHPVLDAKALRAQREIHTIQNTRGISYAGAWLKYGFHEDGFTAGLRAALSVGDSTRTGGDGEWSEGKDTRTVRPPFVVREADHDPRPVWYASVFDLVEITGLRSVVGHVAGIVLVLMGMGVGLAVWVVEALLRMTR
ncbi:FAD/NAD-binding domain-containing protein [Trametopsis cervina]|nr:FAD/NAD-binding domain-containing protein [Trametopsis cervina]